MDIGKINDAIQLLKDSGFKVVGNGIATGINFLGEGEEKKREIFKDLATLIQRDIPYVLMEATQGITNMENEVTIVLIYPVTFEKDDDTYSLKK